MKLTGHVKQREDGPRAKCRLWELVANLPKKGNAYPTRTRRFHGTYREAQAELRDFLAELESEHDPSKVTFSVYARDWHDRRRKSGIYAQNTMDSEADRINAALPLIGAMKMRDVTTHDVEDMYASLGWAPKSVEGMHKTLSTLFKDAVRDAVIASTPISDAKRPPVPEAERVIPDAATVDAMMPLLDLDSPTQRAVAMCAYCGLRRAEACGLEWEDFADGSVTVARACNKDSSTKTTKSRKVRTVPVPDALMRRLPKGSGRLAEVRPDAVTRWWTRHRSEFGMDGVRLHDLRHSYLTRLARAGVHPRVMMELAGHSSIDVCMQIYTHVDVSDRRAAVDRAFETLPEFLPENSRSDSFSRFRLIPIFTV